MEKGISFSGSRTKKNDFDRYNIEINSPLSFQRTSKIEFNTHPKNNMAGVDRTDLTNFS